ncbi:MAG: hypothetical protein U0T84_07525 [Chitinophagales bacterium]
MELSENWLTEGLYDFEYKKYQLLAYLQRVRADFKDQKLYPRLSELVQHYRNLEGYTRHKKLFVNQLPKKIAAIDLQQLQLEYQQTELREDVLAVLDEIASYALPQIKQNLDDGKALYDAVEQQVDIFPVGIIPMHNQEGYFFLRDYAEKTVGVYAYQITLFESATETLRGIKTDLVYEYASGISNTYESVKYQLIKEKRLPAPATYVMEFKLHVPLNETRLPLAKRMLVRYLHQA